LIQITKRSQILKTIFFLFLDSFRQIFKNLMKKHSIQHQLPLTERCKAEWVAPLSLDGPLPLNRRSQTPSNTLFATDASTSLAALN
jgi:hypothetical protein